MAASGENLQAVTFFLGDELYGIGIMDVKEIVRLQPVREIPGAPRFVEGIFDLRGEIIPVISLHKRFNLKRRGDGDADEFSSGIVIICAGGMKLGVIVDKISRVATIPRERLRRTPHMLAGIGREYIKGIAGEDGEHLILLDTERLFSAQEIRQISEAAE